MSIKRSVSLLTAALMIVALISGCGGSGGGAATTAAATDAAAAATTAAPATTAAAAEAATTTAAAAAEATTAAPAATTTAAAAAATTAAATAAAEPATTAAAAQNEPITLQIIGNIGSSSYMVNGIMDNPVALYIREHTGITIDLTMIPDSGDSTNRLNAMIAANDLPDIFINNGGTNQLRNLIDSDLILPLDDLVASHAPNLSADNRMQAMMLQRKMSTPEGNLYLIGLNIGYGDSPAFGPRRGFFIRWDLYKQLGYPEITNTLEMCDVLAAMCELEPLNKNGQKMYAAAVWNNAFNDAAFQPQALMMGYATGPSNMLYIDIETNEIFLDNPLKERDSFIWESLRWCNKLNQMGLFDPDSYTQTYQNYQDKTAAGHYMMGALTWSNGTANTAYINDGTPDKQLICLPSSVFGWDKVALYDSIVGGERGWAISRNCKEPERAMQLLDFVSTIEFSLIAHNGVEGLNWTMENGVATPKQEYLDAAKSGDDALTENMLATGARIFRLFTGYAPGTINPADNQTVDMLSSPRELTAMHVDFLNYYGVSDMEEAYTKGMKTYIKNTLFNWGTLPDELITYQTNLTDYINNGYVNCTLAASDEEFFAEQEKFIAGLEPYRIDDIWQAYYDNAISTSHLTQPIVDLLNK